MPSPLALLALGLTALPLPAAAFGDLDCIGTETCTATGCTVSLLVFPVVFDWAAQTVSVGVAGEVLHLALSGDDLDAGGASGSPVYNSPDNAGLVLAFAGPDTRMTLDTGGGTRHLATCAPREAA